MDLSTSRFAKIVETLQNQATSGGSERRRATRVSIQAKLNLATLGAGRSVALRFTAMTHDLSTSGVGLFQSLPLDAGTQLLIELPEGRGRALLIGVVRHTRAAANGIFAVGVEFAEEAPADLVDRWAADEHTELRRIRASMMGP